jgi:hypothetical protein
MRDLVVDADAGRAREAVDQFGSRTSTGCAQVVPADLIQFSFGDAGLDGSAHHLERVGDDASDRLEAHEVIVTRYGHAVSLARPEDAVAE